MNQQVISDSIRNNLNTEALNQEFTTPQPSKYSCYRLFLKINKAGVEIWGGGITTETYRVTFLEAYTSMYGHVNNHANENFHVMFEYCLELVSEYIWECVREEPRSCHIDDNAHSRHIDDEMQHIRELLTIANDVDSGYETN